MRQVWVLLVLVLSGCVTITGYEGERLEVRATEVGLAAVGSVTTTAVRELVAKVKGSIYETGEVMSVFGTCLDSYDLPVAGVNATFSAWYPNGTQFIFDQNITELQTGYYLYTGPMEAVRGTYLTRLRCELNGSIALAFGEWQNPYWVAKINETQGLVNISLQEIETTQQLILNLSYDVAVGFNETFVQINNTNVLINETFVNLSNQITVVGQIANDSVDRNDSLIVQLLYDILNGTPSTGPAGAISFIEEYEDPAYFLPWTINVSVFVGSTRVGSDYVTCYINTTNAPPTVAGVFEPIADTIEDVVSPKFTYTEPLIRKLGDWDWDVWCEAN